MILIGPKIPIVDFYIPQGSSWFADIQFLNDEGNTFDITDGVLRGQIRDTASSPDIAATLVIERINAAESTIRVSLSKDQTEAMTAGEFTSSPDSQKTYDIEWEVNGQVARLCQGKSFIDRNVTR